MDVSIQKEIRFMLDWINSFGPNKFGPNKFGPNEFI